MGRRFQFSIFHAQEATMIGTILQAAPTHFRARVRSIFLGDHDSADRTPARDEDNEAKAERERLPERDESFYWGFCMFGHW